MSLELEKYKGSYPTASAFEHAQRIAMMYSKSGLLPELYKNNTSNIMVAMEMANRVGANPLMVMQNLHIIQGKPSWSSSFIIAALNACGKFTPIMFDVKGERDSLSCTAWATLKDGGDKIEGPTVTMQMAIAEGWVKKTGSKWATMPELMIRYRAATFFGRLYAPELLMGLHSADEMNDIQKATESEIIVANEIDEETKRIKFVIANATEPKHLAQFSGLELSEELTALLNEKIKSFRNGQI